MSHLGDIAPGEEVNFKFTTVDSTGLPTALAGTPAISVYKDNNLTQSTAGITLTVSFDGVTGLNHVNITTISDTSFYIDRASFSAVITAGTVGGTSVVGYVVAQWKMRQTVAEQVWGQSVGALGNVSDSFASAVTEMWNRIGSLLDVAVSTRADQTTANRIEDDTQNIQGRLPTDLVGGRIDSHTGSFADGVLEFDKFAESFWQGLVDRVWGASVGVYGSISDSFGGATAEMWSRLSSLLDVAVSTRAASTSLTAIQTDLDDIQSRLPAGLVDGRMDSHVGSVADGVLEFDKFSESFWQGLVDRVWGASVGVYGSISDAFGSAIAEMWSKIDPIYGRVHTALPNAVPGAANGLLIAGTNSGATSFTDGVSITKNSASGALYVENLGAGSGIQVIGNTHGIEATGGSGASNAGLSCQGGTGIVVSGLSSSGYGISVAADTGLAGVWIYNERNGGYAIWAEAAGANSDGIFSEGTRYGLHLHGGTTGFVVHGGTTGVVPLINDRVDAHVGEVADGVYSFPKFSQNYWDGITSYVWGASVGQFAGVSDGFGQYLNDMRNEIENLPGEVWDVPIAQHLTSGTTGAALNAAGAAGDPWSTTLPGAYGPGTAGFIVGTNVDATISSRASAASLATAQGDLDDIQTRLPASLVNGRIDSHVGSVADGVYEFDKFNESYVAGMVDRIWNASVGPYALTSDSFGQTINEIRLSGGSTAPTAAEIADAVWDEDATVHQTQGSFGQVVGDSGADSDSIWSIANTNLDATVSSRASAASVAAVQSDTDDIQTRLPAGLIDGRIDAHVGSVADAVLSEAKFTTEYFDAVSDRVWGAPVSLYATVSDSYGQIVNDIRNELENVPGEVWDVTLSAHLSAGSTGFALNAAGAAGDPWSTALPGAYGAGTAGFIVGTNLDATVSSRASAASVASVQSDTDDIQARLPAGLVNGRIDAHVGSVADGALNEAKFTVEYFDAVSDRIWGASVGFYATVSDSFGEIVNDIRNKSYSIAGEVWDQTLSVHLTAGSTGFALNAAGAAGDPWSTALPGVYGAGTAGFIIGTNVNATISSRSVPGDAMDLVAGAVDAAALSSDAGDEVAAAVWGYSVGLSSAVSDSFAQAVGEVWNKIGSFLDVAVSTRLASASYTAPPTSVEIADAVWDEPIAGHLSVGSTGEALNSAGGGSSPSQIAEAVWGYSVGVAAPVSDSFGQALGEIWNRVDVNVSTRSSHSAEDVWSVSARLLTAGTNIVLAKGTGVTGFNDLSAADVRAAVGLASANLDAQLDGLPTAVENADALLARSIAGGSNGGRDVTSALRILRNRMLISGSTLTVYQEDDATPAWTSSLTTDAAAIPIVGSDPA